MESDGTRNKLHSLEDVSSLLGGTSVWTLRKHIAVGNIRVTRLGRRVFVDEVEVSRIQREGLPSLSVTRCGRVLIPAESLQRLVPEGAQSRSSVDAERSRK